MGNSAALPSRYAKKRVIVPCKVTAGIEPAIKHILRRTAKTRDFLPYRLKAAQFQAVCEYREKERRDNADTDQDTNCATLRRC
jgi:hypothetical protein